MQPVMSITESTATTAVLTAGDSYFNTLTLSGGNGPFTWKIIGTAPSGWLSSHLRDHRQDVLQMGGTVRVSGNYDFTVEATDSAGNAAVKHFAITVNPYEKHSDAQLIANINTIAYTGPSDIPDVQLQRIAKSVTVPTAVKQGSVMEHLLFRDDSSSATAKRGTDGKIYVLQHGNWIEQLTASLAISNVNLPNGVAGVAYHQHLKAAGSSSNIVWSVAGALPEGLVLNPVSGMLSGTPGKAGMFSFTIKVSDAYGNQAAQDYAISIAEQAHKSAVVHVEFDKALVVKGASYHAIFSSASNLAQAYFDVQLEEPSGAVQTILNWQQGTRGAHVAGINSVSGEYKIISYRSHTSPTDHTGSFTVLHEQPVIVIADSPNLEADAPLEEAPAADVPVVTVLQNQIAADQEHITALTARLLANSPSDSANNNILEKINQLTADIRQRQEQLSTLMSQLAHGGEKPNKTQPSAQSAARIHKVKKNEELWGIAKKYYGDGKQWRKIMEANTKTVKSPQSLKVGTELIIP